MSFNLVLEKTECIRLYSHLKRQEAELDDSLDVLLRRLEAVLFDHLSIADLEALLRHDDERGGKR